MFKETFYDWLKKDFVDSQELQGNAQSFLARYYKEHYSMGEAYDELKRLVDDLRTGATSKELVFHKAKEMYGKSRLQIVKELPDKYNIVAFRSVNPFKGVSESHMTADEVVELANMVLNARIDKAIKEYIYNIDHGRKTDNTLDIIDKLFEEQGIRMEFDDSAKLEINKVGCSGQKDVNSEEFRKEAERVYSIVRDSKKYNIVLPIYQEREGGIFIIGRQNLSSQDRGDGVDRIDQSDLKEAEKIHIKRIYESSKMYYCFVDNSIFFHNGYPKSGIIITVCYSLEDAIKEFCRYRKEMNEQYHKVNGEFISELGEEYRKYFTKD